MTTCSKGTTMAKTVKNLKDKHKNRVWIDQGGFIWFSAPPARKFGTSPWACLLPRKNRYGVGTVVKRDHIPFESYGPYREVDWTIK